MSRFRLGWSLAGVHLSSRLKLDDCREQCSWSGAPLHDSCAGAAISREGCHEVHYLHWTAAKRLTIVLRRCLSCNPGCCDCGWKTNPNFYHREDHTFQTLVALLALLGSIYFQWILRWTCACKYRISVVLSETIVFYLISYGPWSVHWLWVILYFLNGVGHHIWI